VLLTAEELIGSFSSINPRHDAQSWVQLMRCCYSCCAAVSESESCPLAVTSESTPAILIMYL